MFSSRVQVLFIISFLVLNLQAQVAHLKDECAETVAESFQEKVDSNFTRPGVQKHLRELLEIEDLEFVGQHTEPLRGHSRLKPCVWRGKNQTLISTYCQERKSDLGRDPQAYRWIVLPHQGDTFQTFSGERVRKSSSSAKNETNWFYRVSESRDRKFSSQKIATMSVKDLVILAGNLVSPESASSQSSCSVGIVRNEKEKPSDPSAARICSCSAAGAQGRFYPVWLAEMDEGVRPLDDLPQKLDQKLKALGTASLGAPAAKGKEKPPGQK